AEAGFNELAHLARGERKGRLLEWADHLAALEVVEVAASWRAARVLRVLLRELREVLAGLHLLQNLRRFGARLFLCRSVGVFRNADQNVTGTDALALLKGVARVELIALFGREGSPRGHFRVDHPRNLQPLAHIIA